MEIKEEKRIQPIIDWTTIDTVLLDMDGTLLDRNFDDYFWNQYVPEIYGLKHDIPTEIAKNKLMARFKSEEGTLAWTNLDYWSQELELDIPGLKIQVNQLIQIHPYVVDFLKYCREIGKQLHIVTNAHSKTLDIKMRKTAIGDHFDQIVCAEEVGMAKEDPEFLADDNEGVLVSALTYGIKNLIYVARPSSTLPISYSNRFPSIIYFKELIS